MTTRTPMIFCFVLLLASLSVAQTSTKPTIISGQISRHEVASVVEKGPQRFIATIRVDPVMEKGRFVGYRLVGVAADSPLSNSQTVVPGDIIIAVNGESLERPEQFMRAWDVVRDASVLEVSLKRGAQVILYRWSITP